MYSLETAKDVYMAVLDGIKKESTAVLLPDQFNRLINVDAMTEWLNQIAPVNDFDQSIVDALSNLVKVKILEPQSPTPDGYYYFNLPKNYYRLQSVSFKIEKDGKLTDWLPVNRVRSNTYSLAVSGVNPYRKATDKRLYYMQVKNQIKSFPANDKVRSAKIIFLSRPDPIIFNEGDGNNSHGNLNKEQKKDVVDIAVRIFLERVKEERYQTQLTEKTLK